MQGDNRQLLSDLLGGYLDIALQRGRSQMALYDPLAALAVARSDLFEFAPATLVVNIETGVRYGQTSAIDADTHTGFEYVAEIDSEKARRICLSALITA